jgi:hypothetical protein
MERTLNFESQPLFMPVVPDMGKIDFNSNEKAPF